MIKEELKSNKVTHVERKKVFPEDCPKYQVLIDFDIS